MIKTQRGRYRLNWIWFGELDLYIFNVKIILCGFFLALNEYYLSLPTKYSV